MVLLGICLGGVTRLVLTARQVSDRARDHYVAATLAKNRLERAKTFEFIHMELFAESGTVINEDGMVDANGQFRRSTVVSNINPRLASIVVNVDIRNRITLGFDGEKETLQTLVTDFTEVPE